MKFKLNYKDLVIAAIIPSACIIIWGTITHTPDIIVLQQASMLTIISVLTIYLIPFIKYYRLNNKIKSGGAIV